MVMVIGKKCKWYYHKGNVVGVGDMGVEIVHRLT